MSQPASPRNSFTSDLKRPQATIEDHIEYVRRREEETAKILEQLAKEGFDRPPSLTKRWLLQEERDAALTKASLTSQTRQMKKTQTDSTRK